MKKDIQQTRLDSGLTILTDYMQGVRSATLGFFYRFGSRNEPEDLNGISHFIEHTVFKGTAKRTALDIAIETDRLGGNLDAFTTHDETGFAIKVIDDRVEQAFDLISDMLVNPRFDEKELESEQRVIIEEMKMIDDSPEEYLGDLFHKAFFPGHPLGLNIAGTPKTVRSFDHAVTQTYHKQAFNASNLVIAAAGNVEHQAIVDLASSRFTVSGESHLTPLTVPKTSAPILIKRSRDLEQAHIMIATPLVSAKSEKRYAADLLTNIIGGGTSSRLWQKIREERGLAYSVGASAVMFQDCGFFSIFAGASPEKTEEVLDVSIDEMRSLVNSGVTADELDLAKQQTVASILLNLEDSAARASAMAHSELTHGRQIPLAETLGNIDAVTTDDIQAIAQEFFRTENVAFAALGNLNGLEVVRDRLAIS
ncbi:MAG: pitrilysin family protein [Pyrinomonadaceae bacterium]